MFSLCFTYESLTFIFTTVWNIVLLQNVVVFICSVFGVYFTGGRVIRHRRAHEDIVVFPLHILQLVRVDVPNFITVTV